MPRCPRSHYSCGKPLSEGVPISPPAPHKNEPQLHAGSVIMSQLQVHSSGWETAVWDPESKGHLPEDQEKRVPNPVLRRTWRSLPHHTATPIGAHQPAVPWWYSGRPVYHRWLPARQTAKQVGEEGYSGTSLIRTPVGQKKVSILVIG